jgi:DNA end-binding protein Ku
MPRPYWKGHIRLSLVTFPVQLHTATASGARIRFHQLDRRTGQRIRLQKIVPDQGPVANEDIVKGYEIEADRYVVVEPDELAALRLESKHTIDLVQFVDTCEIDPLYFEKPYYVVPDGDMAQEAYRVVHRALRDTGKVALGEVVLGGRENLVAIQPSGRGLLLETLRASDEVKKASGYFAEIEDGAVDDDQLELARELIRRKSAPFDPTRFKDDYETALRELIEAKLQDRELRAPEGRAPAGQVVDLMDALRRSLGAEKPRATSAKRGATAEVRALPAKPGKRQPKEPAGGKPAPRRRKAG